MTVVVTKIVAWELKELIDNTSKIMTNHLSTEVSLNLLLFLVLMLMVTKSCVVGLDEKEKAAAKQTRAIRSRSPTLRKTET